MNKVFRCIQYYLIIGFPFVIACMIWHALQPTINTESNWLWDLLGFNIIAWFSILIVFLISLVLVPSIREKTLTRLANLNERDEREQYITGKAARSTYISTLSLIIALLFFSLFSFKLVKFPTGQEINGHGMQASINIGLQLFNQSQITSTNTSPTQENVLIDTKEISLSASSVLLILLGWQLLAFHLAAKKEQKNHS